MSAKEALPAWLQCEWDQPQELREIQFVFDTGMHRHLTLSHHDGYAAKMHWGRPQPETVRDYAVQIMNCGSWQTACDVVGNYQRLRRHRLPQRIRLS